MSASRRALLLAARLAGGILHPGRLSSLVVFVTHRCNARCPHCFNVLASRPREEGLPLTLAEYEAIASRLPALFQVILSGGEPFLRGDLDALVETFCARAGARLVSIPTNGSRPYRALRALDRMAARRPDATFNLIVSLDAAGDRHDALRRLPGLFAKALSLCRGALALRERRGNVNLVVSTALFEENLDDVPELIRFLREALPSGGWHHNVQYDQRPGSRLALDPALRRKVRAIEDQAEAAATEGLWGRLAARWYVRALNGVSLRGADGGATAYRCAAGRKIAVIMPDGAAFPCEPFAFGEPRLPRVGLRDHGWDYGALSRAPEYAAGLGLVGGEGCSSCAWTCAAAASLAFDPRNWLLAMPDPLT